MLLINGEWREGGGRGGWANLQISASRSLMKQASSQPLKRQHQQSYSFHCSAYIAYVTSWENFLKIKTFHHCRLFSLFS